MGQQQANVASFFGDLTDFPD